MKLTKQLIKDYLKDHNLMQVATNGEDHPWIASLYYTFDNDLNLYFLSSPDTIHSKQIEKNNKVSVAITNSTQNIASDKKGLQIYGITQQISNVAKIKHSIKLWKDFLKVENDGISYENMAKKAMAGRMYKITPKKIKFFNQELFDVEDGKEPILEL